MPYFEDLGVDSVIVDEAHRFKNSHKLGSKGNNLAYLSKISPSQRAKDMSLKMDYLRDSNNGRGPYMLTATPLTSSPVEAFNMLSLTTPMEKFHELGVYTPDDFIDVFGDIDTVDKMTITGDSVAREGLVGFKNLSGLRSLFNQRAIIKNADDVGLEIPQAVDVKADCQLSPEQDALYHELRTEAETGKNPDGEEPRPIFSIMRDMERVATDMDLYNHTLTTLLPKKHHQTLLAVLEEMPQTKTINIMVEGEKEKKDIALDYELDEKAEPMKLVFHQTFESDFEKGLKKHNVPILDVSHPMTPKYSQLLDNLSSEYEGGGKQLIFSSEKSQHRKLTRLIQHHLPIDSKQVGIINADEAAGAKTQKLAHAYNSGSIKIIIANERAEEGVDLQHGTSAIHNLTFPWTPDKLTQRKGRGVRQGNTQSNVQIYNYVSGGTLDEYRLHLIGRKEGWINKILTDDSIHSAKNGDMMEPDELMMLLSSDPEAYQQKLAEAKAKRAKQEETKARAEIVREFRSLMNAEQALKDHDDIVVERAKDRLQERVNDTVESIETIQAQLEKSDSEALQKELERFQLRNAKLSEQLANFDTTHTEKRETIEHKIKRHRAYLTNKNDEGALFFNPRAIQNTGNAVVLNNNTVICIGDIVEVKGGRSNIFDETTELEKVVNIIKGTYIELVDAQGRESTFNLDRASHDAIRPTSKSAEEFDKQALTAKPLNYEKLEDVEQSAYHRYISELKFKGWFLIQNTAGEIQLVDGENNPAVMGQVLWPEPENETACKRVAEFYVQHMRDNKLKLDFKSRIKLNPVMEVWFGYRWDNEDINRYVDLATEADVNAKLAVNWQTLSKQMNIATSDAIDNVATFREKFDPLTKDLLEGVIALGGNFDSIKKWVDQFIAAQENQLIQAADEQKAKQADEAAKNHENFREVPKSLADQLAEVGITARFNTTNIVTATKKIRRRTYGGEEIKAFEALFLHDKNAKNGRLFANKDDLKSRYQALFTTDSPGFDGSWWWFKLPAGYDLQQIKELLV